MLYLSFASGHEVKRRLDQCEFSESTDGAVNIAGCVEPFHLGWQGQKTVLVHLRMSREIQVYSPGNSVSVEFSLLFSLKY